jgi:hypothetical protein
MPPPPEALLMMVQRSLSIRLEFLDVPRCSCLTQAALARQRISDYLVIYSATRFDVSCILCVCLCAVDWSNGRGNNDPHAP